MGVSKMGREKAVKHHTLLLQNLAVSAPSPCVQEHDDLLVCYKKTKQFECRYCSAEPEVILSFL